MFFYFGVYFVFTGVIFYLVSYWFNVSSLFAGRIVYFGSLFVVLCWFVPYMLLYWLIFALFD